MSPTSKAPHLQPARGAMPISTIPAAQLERVNQALREGTLVLQVISHRGRTQTYAVPVQKES